IHHARHRGARARAHRDEQRIGGIAEFSPDCLLDLGEGGGALLGQVFRVALIVGVEIGADFGGDGEARRHRQAEARHLGEVRALAAEKIAHIGAAFRGAAAETVDPFGHHQPSIFEKSATRFSVSRICDSSLSRFARSSRSSVLTVTLLKNSSTGTRKRASAAMAPAKSSASNALPLSAVASFNFSASSFSAASRKSPGSGASA